MGTFRNMGEALYVGNYSNGSLNSSAIFCHRLSTIRLSRIIICILMVLVVVPVVTHYYISRVGDAPLNGQLDLPDDLSSLKARDLKLRIEEMQRIKTSVKNELQDLEAKRQKLQAEMSSYNHKIEDLKLEFTRKQFDLDKMKLSITQAELAHKEVLEKNQPELLLPLKLKPMTNSEIIPSPNDSLTLQCCSASCIDYSRCSITGGFPVFVYPLNSLETNLDDGTIAILQQTLKYNPHITSNPQEACIFIVFVDKTSTDRLENLQQWKGDGRNHVLLNLATLKNMATYQNLIIKKNYGRSMIVQSAFVKYRPDFDLVAPPLLGPPGSDVWQDLPLTSPARRKFLLSFAGNCRGALLETIKVLENSPSMDLFSFNVNCQSDSESTDELPVCGTQESRLEILQQSTFTLIPMSSGVMQTSLSVQLRLYEALKSGAVPVLVSHQNSKFLLPYDEYVDWKLAAILIAESRLPELHFVLRSVSDKDILTFRRQGRLFWERYFGSVQSIIDTIIAVYRTRVGVPPLPLAEEPSPSVFNSSFTPLQTEPVLQDPNEELDENLGPLEPPYASPKFQRNFSISFLNGYEMWNKWAHPFYLFPNLPFDPVMPSESKFVGSSVGFRPIGGGIGGAGKEFSENLGGNQPREHFTIVMLTYEREQVLLESLSRLHGLPYLHKVVVVWNSPRGPSADLRWPSIGVPIEVVRTLKNSLNNRFLPYDAIETEAVLSVDDDAHLRHDEIIFGFRVWRENRDRVVGFPGRYHAWDLEHQNWLYNANYSCELSMVLTGAAFFHKYYMYMYSTVMPQAIRDKVDEFMNCEDIAMNFLVSHITRQPPVKVTSRWTFRCPGCPVSLSEDETHFQERHKCINFFVKVYGYMPLLNTQYRVDSVLFKTRIPHDKQKCFKFI